MYGELDRNIWGYDVAFANIFYSPTLNVHNGRKGLFIRYLGACNGCASGGATLFAIEAILREKLSESIRVLPI